jgi:MFS family permease
MLALTRVPMMLGLVAAATMSGQIMSRTGKYKALGITSLCLTLVSTVLLSTMDGDTSGLRVLLYSALLGIGSGATIPVFNIAVQNAFPYRQLGIATSSMQFSRNMGATVGAALFGYLLKENMNTGFASLDLANVPRAVLEVLKNPRTLSNEAAMNAIRTHMPQQFLPLFNDLVIKTKDILVHSLQMVFIFSIAVIVIGVIASFVLKELPLRRHHEEGFGRE